MRAISLLRTSPALALAASLLGAAATQDTQPRAAATGNPNVVLLMSDDQGYGDTGYGGHPVLQTPHLDAMAERGVRFTRFYSAAPVCSPTRGSALTGRHPYRYGILGANVGHLPAAEVTLAEILRARGYATGHFGKWHLGTLTKTRKDSNRGGPRQTAHYAPPWEHGFLVCFSTEAKVPTFDPMLTPPRWTGARGDPGTPYGTAYWTGPERACEDDLQGDDSQIIMDRVLPFVRDAVRRRVPFFAVVWFHAPHRPVLAGPEALRAYEDNDELTRAQRQYYACITALDRQVGRLRQELRALGQADDTMLWFTSDNGPEGRAGRAPGSTGGLRGRKRSLYEGGIRVPGLLEWPAGSAGPRLVSAPASTCDYLPTILAALSIDDAVDDRPLDGIDLLPLVRGERGLRGRPLAFESRRQIALVDDRYKLIARDVEPDRAPAYELYDLHADPAEQVDLAAEEPERLRRMVATLSAWRQSHQRSAAGADY